MPRNSRPQRGSTGQRQAPATGRPSLIPKEPLSGWLALVQVLVLLGLPIALLLLAKIVLKTFFPELGY